MTASDISKEIAEQKSYVFNVNLPDWKSPTGVPSQKEIEEREKKEKQKKQIIYGVAILALLVVANFYFKKK